MPYCSNCGEFHTDNAKFCSNCGAPTAVTKNEDTQRKSVYDGDIHKCPSCGESIKSFVANCPSCGHEFRGSSVTNTVKEFSEKLEWAITDEQQEVLIRSYPIPNTKEDLLEFMILASSNFNAQSYAAHPNADNISSAWFSKIEQCYQKAKVTLVGVDLERIQGIYNGIIEEISAEKQSQRQLQIKKEKDQSAQKFKKSKFRFILIIYCILCVILSAVAFEDNEFLAGIVGVIIVILIITAFLMGYGVINERIKNFRLIPSIIAFLLFIPFVGLYSGDLTVELPHNYKKDLEPIIWGDFALGSNLPDFGCSEAHVVQDNENCLSLYFYKIDKSKYDDYVQACENFGFSIDADKGNNSFSGYNKMGYRLTLGYSTLENNNRVSIKIDDPIKNEIIHWPKSELTRDLPVPKSLTGEVYTESDSLFIVYLVNLDHAYFDEYVARCMESGFDLDYYKGDNYFNADNKGGTSLTIEYKGFNTLCINISNFNL